MLFTIFLSIVYLPFLRDIEMLVVRTMVSVVLAVIVSMMVTRLKGVMSSENVVVGKNDSAKVCL